MSAWVGRFEEGGGRDEAAVRWELGVPGGPCRAPIVCRGVKAHGHPKKWPNRPPEATFSERFGRVFLLSLLSTRGLAGMTSAPQAAGHRLDPGSRHLVTGVDAGGSRRPWVLAGCLLGACSVLCWVLAGRALALMLAWRLLGACWVLAGPLLGPC